MSFLTPLFLLGAAAIVGPIAFHLIRRITRDKTVFSSLMFLQPEPPRLTRRNRLEHWLLLLLRCFALALLALGFARPFFKESAANDPANAPARRILLLVDTSASMRRSGLWADARAQAERTLRNITPSDQVALFTFGRETRSLVGFAEWNSSPIDARVPLVTGRLAEASPGWSGTNLGAALIAAAEALNDASGEKLTGLKQIVLITDLQAGSQLDALQAYEWPRGIELVVEPLKAHTRVNAGVQLLAEAADVDHSSATTMRLRVTNAADSNREQFKLGWTRSAGAEFVGPTVDTYVPPGQSRVVSLPIASANGAEAISLRGDDEDFDNTVYVIPPSQQKITVAYVGGENADDARQPLFFLKRALPASPRLAVNIVAQSLESALSNETQAASVIVVTDAVPAATATALHEQAITGKTVLFVPKNVAAAASLGPLIGAERVAADEAQVKNYSMLSEIDFQHPLFAPFADPRYSDFTKIHFWKYRKLEVAGISGVRMLMKFDNGDPAFVEIPVGKGRVLALAGGWNPEDSQFAVSSKFVPLLFSLLEYSGALTAPSSQQFVGDAVAMTAPATERASVKLPDGSTLPLAVGAKTFAQTTTPGIYRVTSGGTVHSFAVNLDAAESRTTPLPLEELERLGAPLAKSHAAVAPERAAARQAILQSGEAEGRQKLWRWFLVATLIVLFTESLLAGRTARKTAPAAQPGTP